MLSAEVLSAGVLAAGARLAGVVVAAGVLHAATAPPMEPASINASRMRFIISGVLRCLAGLVRCRRGPGKATERDLTRRFATRRASWRLPTLAAV
jgi:hypothetical protein